MVIGDDFSAALHEKAGTEDVDLEMGSRAAVGELHHAFVVDQRLASSIDGDLNRMAGFLVKEFDDNVEQADAGAVIVDDGFSDLAFAFEQFQAMLRVCELALQGISIRAARRSYFLTEILRLRFQRISCDRCRLRLRLKRSARELRAMQELTLQAQTATQTRDFRSQLTSFLARTAAGNAQIDRREHSGRAENENSGDQPEPAFAKRATQQLEDDIRKMLSLHGVLEHGLELFLRLAFPELRPDPGGKFHRFEGKRNHVIGAEVQGASTLHGSALNDH